VDELSDLTAVKRSLREGTIIARDRLGEAARAQASRDIVEALRGLLASRPPSGFLMCLPFGSEADLGPLGDDPPGGWAAYIPRTDWRGRKLDICRLPCTLVRSRFGLLEPARDVPAVSAEDVAAALGVALVPGVAFSRVTRHRLGYGGGFFDRFLADYPSILAIGVAFSMQMLDQVPHGAHDLPMHMLVSEDGVL
jgi:5-formyltetrahydrofolate cyclo-ligase